MNYAKKLLTLTELHKERRQALIVTTIGWSVLIIGWSLLSVVWFTFVVVMFGEGVK